MPLSTSLQHQITGLVNSHRAVLFMKGSRLMPQCGFSARVVDILDDLLHDYETVDILAHPELRAGMKEYSQWPTFPQLYLDGSFVGGCDIVSEMHQSGELRRLLGANDDAASKNSQADSCKVIQMDAIELRRRLDQGTITLFDVRPAAERALARIGEAHPLDAEGREVLSQLNPQSPIALHCHHGTRSQAVAQQLLSSGFQTVFNLSGGIDAWSRTVDPTVPRY